VLLRKEVSTTLLLSEGECWGGVTKGPSKVIPWLLSSAARPAKWLADTSLARTFASRIRGEGGQLLQTVKYCFLLPISVFLFAGLVYFPLTLLSGGSCEWGTGTDHWARGQAATGRQRTRTIFASSELLAVLWQ
jgi:hypothetical protein